MSVQYSHFARYKTEHGVFFLLHVGFKTQLRTIIIYDSPATAAAGSTRGNKQRQPNTRNTTQYTRPRSHGTRHGHETVAAAAAASLVRLPCNSDCVLYQFGIRHARRRNTSAFCARAAAHPEKKTNCPRGRRTGNCYGRRNCCSPSVRVASRVDGAEPGHPPTPGLKSIGTPYLRNKLVVTMLLLSMVLGWRYRAVDDRRHARF